ncbi:hypothetical protein FRB94_014575 [Tulasnella sp. JGI-2019a]|nr:hypothetical protein FRB93_010977 [Tulasnella sp. JGI-2019a]KAG9007192.1 hypothetical protein FRB94_014575 [Tulasnella sp. JGI-2019a]
MTYSPSLAATRDAGEDVSVLAGGNGQKIDLDDLGLKKTYSTTNTIGCSPTYTDMAFEACSSLSSHDVPVVWLSSFALENHIYRIRYTLRPPIPWAGSHPSLPPNLLAVTPASICNRGYLTS